MYLLYLTITMTCMVSVHATTLRVSNGGVWGGWAHATDYCAPGHYAKGYRQKIERPQGSGDDTALNAITLICDNDQTVTSKRGPWGSYRASLYCTPGHYLSAFALQVESRQGNGDDTAANYIRFRCTDGRVIGDGSGYWGSFGSWSNTCGSGGAICGMKTRVEDPQGSGDDTALNDVEFTCCKV